MDGKTLARIGAVAFVALAITATAIELSRKDDRSEAYAPSPQPVSGRNPLDVELARCSGLGEVGARDTACLKAWAQNRRRFLGQESTPSTSDAPVASMATDSAAPKESAPAPNQSEAH